VKEQYLNASDPITLAGIPPKSKVPVVGPPVTVVFPNPSKERLIPSIVAVPKGKGTTAATPKEDACVRKFSLVEKVFDATVAGITGFCVDRFILYY
jgi:hypothetical protein